MDLLDLTADELEAYEERAAIMEYESNLPRDEAERLALRDVLDGRKVRLV